MDLVHVLLFILIQPFIVEQQTGPSSHYEPNDGYNSGNLACGGRYDWDDDHIAHRSWRKLGCGRPVMVWSPTTNRLVLTKVWDAGPFGIVSKEGGWRVWTKRTPPKGWRWRGIVDMSHKTWVRLDKPRFLSSVSLFFITARGKRLLRAVSQGVAIGRALLYVALDSGADALQYLGLGRDDKDLLQPVRSATGLFGQGDQRDI